MKKAIVTGANGFVGTALLNELSERGVEIYAVVMNEQENISAIQDIPGVHILYSDMAHLAELAGKLPKGVDAFFHLAWAGSSGSARADTALQLQNVQWTVDAVRLAAAVECNRFVGAGTLAELDVLAYSPLPGSTPNTVANYGVAKFAAHCMSKAECNKLGVAHLWPYLSNTYGIGNYTSNFINFASKTMLTHQPANFTPGVQPYDFVYISDIVHGLYCIGNKGKENETYYIGSNAPRQLKEFVIELRDMIDPEIELNLGAVPFNGVAHDMSVFDCTKLIRDTGYQPKVSFSDGIKKTVKWIDEQLKEGKL